VQTELKLEVRMQVKMGEIEVKMQVKTKHMPMICKSRAKAFLPHDARHTRDPERVPRRLLAA
jgi:hypothetical protein